MRFGRFSSDGLEYHIVTPETPRPWINYLTNEIYCCILSQCAGGYSFFRDCRTHRITRWAPENWHKDRPGKYLFLKDEEGTAWSATYQPIRVRPDAFLCRHGLGYTTIRSEYRGWVSEVTYFVPESDPCEVWSVRLTNTADTARRIEVFPYVEFLIGDYHEELRYRNIMNLYNRIWFDEGKAAVFAKKTAQWQGMNIRPFEGRVFLASSLPVKAACTQKDAFMGRYNDETRPQAVLGRRFPHFPICSGEDGVGAFRHVIRLRPGQTKTFTVVLGQAENAAAAGGLIERYRDLDKTREALRRVRELWRTRILDNVSLETPDEDFNTFFNIWVKYQLYICNFWSRSPSYYHEGSGGRGYRDSCQDAEAIAALNPRLTRERILKVASLIRRDGTSAPGWSETSGPHKFRPNKDHQVWLTMTTAAYIRETGDRDILFEYVPYLKDRWRNGWEEDPEDCGGPRTDGEGTLLEHLEKNLRYCFNDVGARGFPRIGHADWNDAIDAAGIRHRGESVWLAQALVRSMKTFVELCELVGDEPKKTEFFQMTRTMEERINGEGWDGRWYVRGFDDDGVVYGSRKDKEGARIFLNTQAWAILAGVAQGDRLRKVVRSVAERLDGPHGLALFSPAYDSWVPRLGRISMFSEGTKENAAVFCHAVTFMAVALAMSGRGDEAYAAIRKIMPNTQKDMDLYKTEPYAMAEYLVGPQNPYRYGEGAFTWITGSSGWSFLLAVEWILGARRDFEGLRIDPCLPSHWKRCWIRRPFRGDVYEIEILNPDGVERGVREIEVDGRRLIGQVILPFRDGAVHRVKVTMGRKRC